MSGKQEVDNVGKILTGYGASEGWHVVTTIHNANGDIFTGQLLSDIGQNGSAVTAITINMVAVQASFFVHELTALENRTGTHADD